MNRTEMVTLIDKYTGAKIPEDWFEDSDGPFRYDVRHATYSVSLIERDLMEAADAMTKAAAWIRSVILAAKLDKVYSLPQHGMAVDTKVGRVDNLVGRRDERITNLRVVVRLAGFKTE